MLDGDSQIRRGRPDDADAFIRDDGQERHEIQDSLAAMLADDFLASATSGEETAAEDFEQEVPEDIGGPFLVTDGGREFDFESDGTDTPDSTREPLPTVMGHGPPTQEQWDQAEAEEAEEQRKSGASRTRDGSATRRK